MDSDIFGSQPPGLVPVIGEGSHRRSAERAAAQHVHVVVVTVEHVGFWIERQTRIRVSPVLRMTDLVGDGDELGFAEAVDERHGCRSHDRTSGVAREELGASGERVLGANAAERAVSAVEADIDDDERPVG